MCTKSRKTKPATSIDFLLLPDKMMRGDEWEREEEREGSKTEEELLQNLRSKATELLLREEWQESSQVYTQFIDLCGTQISRTNQRDPDPDSIAKLRKSLCLALCNRAEARARLRDFSEALRDCDRALEIDSTHFKTLLCKGKILLALSKYSLALDCFEKALLSPQASDNLETVNGYREKCKKLEFQAKTGSFDLSDWILSGFLGKSPELAEFIGPFEIKKSEIGGRGLFAVKNIGAGSLILVTKAIATERGILGGGDSCENAQLVMWKNFINKVTESIRICGRTHQLMSTLSIGLEEDNLEVPDISLFWPEANESDNNSKEKLDTERLLSILDVNSLVEDTVSAKVMGKNKDYYGVGLWILASFINHSCVPNARRLHVGDYMMIHASRDIKAGEEITFAYFDALSPLDERKRMAESWGFNCQCRRCKFENCFHCSKQELREITMSLQRGVDAGNAIYMLEEGMKRWMVKGKEKGYLRASYWGAYDEIYNSERLIRRWRRKLPAMEIVVESVFEAIGSDERLMKMVVEGLKKNGGSSNMLEMERAMKLGRGVYGKVVLKKKAMKSLIGLEG